MRGHGGSEWPADGRYDVEALVEDLRAVLAQLGSRPMVVAATLGGWIAGAALARDAALLASGLVLIDLHLRSEGHRAGEEGVSTCRTWRSPDKSKKKKKIKK